MTAEERINKFYVQYMEQRRECIAKFNEYAIRREQENADWAKYWFDIRPRLSKKDRDKCDILKLISIAKSNVTSELYGDALICHIDGSIKRVNFA